VASAERWPPAIYLIARRTSTYLALQRSAEPRRPNASHERAPVASRLAAPSTVCSPLPRRTRPPFHPCHALSAGTCTPLPAFIRPPRPTISLFFYRCGAGSDRHCLPSGMGTSFHHTSVFFSATAAFCLPTRKLSVAPGTRRMPWWPPPVQFALPDLTWRHCLPASFHAACCPTAPHCPTTT